MGNSSYKVWNILVPLMMFTACYGPVELGRDLTSADRGSGGGRPLPGEGTKSLYVTGVEYPEGYQWRPSLGNPPAGTVLFMMKDGRRILEIAADESGGIEVEPDTHRCIGGHLFTDSSTDSETIIKCDGNELFRFIGREMIVSLLVVGEDVYTLGQPRSGTGWAYRKNGNIILYKGVGSPLPSGLHIDGEKVCFVYEDRIETAGSDILRYYSVIDGQTNSVWVPDDVIRVDDAVLSGGDVLYIAFRKGIGPAVLTRGGDGKAYGLNSGETMTGCRFLENSEVVLTFGRTVSGGTGAVSFWRETDRIATYGKTCDAISFDSDGEDVFALCMDRSGGNALLFKNADPLELDKGYEAIFDRTIASSDGKCCAALVEKKNLRPALWNDGRLTAFDFNGYFTSVSWW